MFFCLCIVILLLFLFLCVCVSGSPSTGGGVCPTSVWRAIPGLVSVLHSCPDGAASGQPGHKHTRAHRLFWTSESVSSSTGSANAGAFYLGTVSFNNIMDLLQEHRSNKVLASIKSSLMQIVTTKGEQCAKFHASVENIFKWRKLSQKEEMCHLSNLNTPRRL